MRVGGGPLRVFGVPAFPQKNGLEKLSDQRFSKKGDQGYHPVYQQKIQMGREYSFYAAVAFLGLTAISGFIIGYQVLFRLLAGIALVLVGIRVFHAVPAEISPVDGQEPYLRDYLSMLAITAANPLTIIFFVTILPGFGIVAQGMLPETAVSFVAGVFLGSVLWWIILCGAVGSVRSRLSTGNLRRINQISGILVTCFGAGMLALLILAPGFFR